jgi:hypothetical protein
MVLEQIQHRQDLTKKRRNNCSTFFPGDAADYWADQENPFRYFYSFL